VNEKEKYGSFVLLLIIISTIIRSLLAATLELGNDEVYYVLYARYPDWSHFDHPLMVGLVIQLFSLDLLFESEFIIRLSSIVFGAINIWLIYQIGKTIKNEKVGLIAAILYVSSVYATVIAGIFILPDTPQSLFWLLSILLMIRVLPLEPGDARVKRWMLLLGISLGLGIISKYTTVFLWFGMGLYFILFRRDWLRSPYVYVAALLSLIIASPILIWNYQNDWISFVFHGSRVNSIGFNIDFHYFFRELFGQILYNNPINFLLIVLSLFAFFNGKLYLKNAYLQIIILTSLPLIATFLIISLTRATLPHWTAPSYTTLILIAAVWLDQIKSQMIRKTFLISSSSLLLLTLLLGFLQINFGIISFNDDKHYNKLGSNDISLDMIGFEQTGSAFAKIYANDVRNGVMDKHSIMVGDNWFPLANYDFYVASPLGMNSFGIGGLDHIHKYAWINKINGGFKKGMDAYYISDSRYYREPGEQITSCFESVEIADTIQIYRNNKIVKRAFVYRLKNMIEVPVDLLTEAP
jgi:hypothetical protein